MFPDAGDGTSALTIRTFVAATSIMSVCGVIYMFFFILLYYFLTVDNIYAVNIRITDIYRSSENIKTLIHLLICHLLIYAGCHLRCLRIANDYMAALRCGCGCTC